MQIFDSPESFSLSLSERYEHKKNEENLANVAVPEKLVVEQHLPPANSSIIGGQIEFKLSRRSDLSFELLGLLVISQEEHEVKKIILPPLAFNINSDYEKISVKYQLRFQSSCVLFESQYSVHKRAKEIEVLEGFLESDKFPMFFSSSPCHETQRAQQLGFIEHQMPEGERSAWQSIILCCCHQMASQFAPHDNSIISALLSVFSLTLLGLRL